MSSQRRLSVFAPAKINLHLHVTGRLDNGYHTLDSLAAFVDIGDTIRMESANEFSFHVNGPFASSFTAAERDSGVNSSNLAVRAVWLIARAMQREPKFRMTLEKNLPLASGMGGGSANAAAAIWGAMEWWELSPQAAPFLHDLMTELGADVPVCLNCVPVLMRGIGDIIESAPLMAETPIVLVNPAQPCRTAEVFRNFDGEFSEAAEIPANLSDIDDLAWFVEKEGNDLMPTAVNIVPEIEEAVRLLQEQRGCAAAGMSGSGATCFGLFRDDESAIEAARKINDRYTGWWVKAGTLNRPERY